MTSAHRGVRRPRDAQSLLVGHLPPCAGEEHEVERVPDAAVEEAVSYEYEEGRQQGEHREEVVQDLEVL